MPIFQNTKEKYYQYGTRGKRYYYKTKKEQEEAYEKAYRQMQAIQRSRFRKYLF